MRWTLSLNVRSEIARKTHELFELHKDYAITKEATPGRIKHDNVDQQMVLSCLKRFNIFTRYFRQVWPEFGRKIFSQNPNWYQIDRNTPIRPQIGTNAVEK